MSVKQMDEHMDEYICDVIGCGQRKCAAPEPDGWRVIRVTDKEVLALCPKHSQAVADYFVRKLAALLV